MECERLQPHPLPSEWFADWHAQAELQLMLYQESGSKLIARQLAIDFANFGCEHTPSADLPLHPGHLHGYMPEELTHAMLKHC